ncbi:hypothetical protein Ancab_014285 [Ancistrocladus abbreviatus]
MEITSVASQLHRRSPSSDRFLGLFTPSGSPMMFSGGIDYSIAGDDDLNEAEVFWTSDLADSNHRSSFPTDSGYRVNHQLSNNQPEEKFGIPAALAEFDRSRILQSRPVLSRRGSTSSSSSPARMIPAIPKPPVNHQEREYGDTTRSLNCGSRKLQNSAPMSIPMAITERRRRLSGIDGGDEEEDDDDVEMLPPHEMVALKVKATSSSVLEGVGRTLKGRDLRQVRNTVWRQTGFLD